MSHETYTPARGGCSEAEAVSLKHAFGSNYTKIEVTNTKGMTGHTMGTSIEDVVAARALQVGRVPPIVNYKVPDPKLLGLKLSKGGNHQCEYALRMAAGFGSQGNYLLLKKWDNSNQSRIDDPTRYQNWLNEISGHEDASLEITGRVLRVVDKKNDNKGKTKSIGLIKTPALIKPSIPVSHIINDRAKITLLVISEITGYPPEMIEEDMEMESDLGIDTVKQATILSTLSERFSMTEKVDFQMSAYPTVGHLINFFANGLQAENRVETVQSSDNPRKPVQKKAEIGRRADEVLQVIAEITGYPSEMIEKDMEMESDLGIDTVKQATILATLSERFGMTEKVDFQMSAYPTVGHLMILFDNGSQQEESVENPQPHRESTPVAEPQKNGVRTPYVVQVIADITGYPPEMIE
jgi:acyl carrier protein